MVYWRDSIRTVPAATHCTVWRTVGTLEAKLLLLHFRWGDGRLLEDGTDSGTRRDSIVELLVVAVVTSDAREVKVFPLGRVDAWASEGGGGGG